MTRRTLPPFPVDDVTLAALEHALAARLDFDEDGAPFLMGAEYGMAELLDFLSGYDPALSVQQQPGVYVYDAELYSRDDVIRALIAEVHRLRA